MKKLISVLLAVVLVAVFGVFALGSSSTDDKTSVETSAPTETSSDSTEAPESTSEANGKTVVNVGDTLDANGLKITFDSSEKWTSNNQFIQPEEGKMYVRAHITIKNESGADKFTGGFDFDCYADGVKCDSSIYGDDTLTSATISDGRSIKGYVYYEVPKDAKEIELEYEVSFWSGKKAIFKMAI